MRDLIKCIRASLNMTQAEFASHAGVSADAVFHWEDGSSTPGREEQSAIYSLCKENAVSVYDMTLKKISDAAQEIRLNAGQILLYHGSKSGITGPIAPKSRPQCDFGKGFYMGTNPEQALTLICDYEQSKFYIVSFDTQQLTGLDVPADINWAMLVAYYRGRMEKIRGTPFYNRYRDMANGKDFVIGNIADDRMYYVIDNFFIGNITDAALVHSLSALQLGKQYVAISQRGCSAVRIEREISISYLERLFLKDTAETNRTIGISSANEICRNYRREGLFFDEILDRHHLGE